MSRFSTLPCFFGFLFGAAAIPTAGKAAPDEVAPIWTSVPGFSGPAAAGVVTVDLDGNGIHESVVSGTSRLESPGPDDRWFLAVIHKRPDVGFRTRTLRRLGPGESFLGRIATTLGPDGAPRVVAVVGNSVAARLVQFAGPELTIVAEAPVSYDFRLHDVADVDADGDVDVVGCPCAEPFTGPAQIRDLATGNVQWTGETPGVRTRVGQLDADPALELVVGGLVSGPGYIVDGATHLTQWTYAQGFNGKIVFGNFHSGTAGTEFAVVGNLGGGGIQGVTRVFRTQPDFAPSAVLTLSDAGGLASADTNGDGLHELVFGTGFASQIGNFVQVISLESGTQFQTYPNIAQTVSGLAVGPLTTPSSLDLIHGAGVDSTGRDALRILDMASGITHFAQFDEAGPHSTVVVGDVRGVQIPEVIRVSWSSEAWDAGPVVQSIDAASGLESRITTSAMRSRGNDEGVTVALAQIDGDPQLEILIGGQDEYDAKVEALDGLSFERQWLSPALATGLSAVAEALLFVPGNGTSDDRVFVAVDGTLISLSAQTGQSLAPPITLASDGPSTLVAANQDDDAALEISFGTGSTVHVFDAETMELDGYMTADPLIIGQRIERDGDSCTQVLVFTNRIERRTCLVGSLLSQRQLGIADATYVDFVTDSHGDLVLGDGHRVFLDHEGQIVERTRDLGNAVGWRNRGHVRVDNGVVHVVVGGQDSVHGIQFGGSLFADSFE